MRISFFLAAMLTGTALYGAFTEAAERIAVGYVVEAELKGADLSRGTVVRDGKELAASIWMPLYAGDVVFVRDGQSHVLVDFGEGGRTRVDESRKRLEISEEKAHGSASWNLITQIGEILTGAEEESVPTNLISKGDEGQIKVPAANRGPNFIVKDDRPIRLVWQGGAGPFSVFLEDSATPLATTGGDERSVEFTLPANVQNRVVLVISDAKSRKLRIPLHLKPGLPQMPAGLASTDTPPELALALKAGWLAARDGGAWRLEAVRMLERGAASNAKLARLAAAVNAGWMPR